MPRSWVANEDVFDESHTCVQVVDDGRRPDYGSGPHLAVMAAAVGLARKDLSNSLYSDEARAFLRSPLVDLFAECIGYGGSFE